jgi:hypothetical protein
MSTKKKIDLKLKIAGVLISCAVLFGCGYSLAPRGENIDSLIRNVYVKPFENKTVQPEVENYVRTAFVNQFIRNSRFQIVNSAESADAVVYGKILNYVTSPLSRLVNDLAAEERVTMTMEVFFEDNINGKVIWKTNNMTDSVDYRLTQDINLLSAIRKKALMKLSNDMSERVFNLMMSGF